MHILALALLLPYGAYAEFLTFDSQAAWEANWSLKPQLNIFTPQGHLGLVKFRKDINAALDAHLFVHPTNERGDVAGGIWSCAEQPKRRPPDHRRGCHHLLEASQRRPARQVDRANRLGPRGYWPERSASTFPMKKGLHPSASLASLPLQVPTWRL